MEDRLVKTLQKLEAYERGEISYLSVIAWMNAQVTGKEIHVEYKALLEKIA